ncbi:hypothetical protein Q5H92_26055 [Hymenobacter sp. M29]|uniref:Glycosyltransferase RgtA/B/C/D-like domain-containing protein n=1 Tax=Hymenobacter mellowenesis TaxID=3063995 RepID=A0ABT9AJ06_9BACT|nr:hypothetical protein [Hymenobacter sp. M29]MDO7849851.1 hypothetical protein [Hymenobacter sp. M29]
MYPSFNHAWAQADWLAIALQFRARGYDFFHPATFNLLTTDGVTGAGFPLPAYVSALLMGLVGRDAPGLMRGVTLAASLGGLLALFGLVRRASGSAWKGAGAALFAFFSPIYVFYQANFLPSVPAFAAVLVGYYCFYRALQPGTSGPPRGWLATAVAWLALAAAMRTPFALPLLCTLGHLVVLRQKRTAAGLGWRAVVAFYGAAFLLLTAVFLYNEHLSRVYQGSMFLARPRAFASWAEFVSVTQTVREYWLWNILSKPQWLLLFLVVATVAGQQGRLLRRSEWLGHWLALAAGAVAYYGLMGPLFAIHDYYLLDSFFLPLVLAFAGCLAVWRVPEGQTARLATAAAVLLLSGAAIWKAQAEQHRRTTPPPTDKSVLTRDNFLNSARWLDSLGVPRTAKLLVLDAYSYNLPLLLAQRRGWTLLQNRNSPENLTPENLARALAMLPADYVVTQNATFEQEVARVYPAIRQRLQLVADNGRLSLWRIRRGPLKAY